MQIPLVSMREFSIDSKPSQQDLKYSDMEVASGHCNQIFSKLDRLCVDLEHNGLFSEVILVFCVDWQSYLC